jgi:hypothetical protein
MHYLRKNNSERHKNIIRKKKGERNNNKTRKENKGRDEMYYLSKLINRKSRSNEKIYSPSPF